MLGCNFIQGYNLDCSFLKKILVYGYYGADARNTGDELFKVAFRHLFPTFEFIFTDYLTVNQINSVETIFIGGGSFLYAPLNGEDNILSAILTKKIFYLGVGVEDEPHSHHKLLLRKSQVVAVRSGLNFVQDLAPHAILIKDLVYSLAEHVKFNNKKKKSILILPNTEVIPKWNNPHWEHTAFEYFKSEFVQALDELENINYNLNFASMCKGNSNNDVSSTIEIINKMSSRNLDINIGSLPDDFEELTKLISSYEIVISQRYHGIVLAELCKVPCISIYHHDKLRYINYGYAIPFYGINKSEILNAVKQVKNINFPAINLNIFGELKNKVLSKI